MQLAQNSISKRGEKQTTTRKLFVGSKDATTRTPEDNFSQNPEASPPSLLKLYQQEIT